MASRATATSSTPSVFGLSGLFSTSSLHLFIFLLYCFSVFWGAARRAATIFFRKGGVRFFRALFFCVFHFV
jgi:hypothetical protein